MTNKLYRIFGNCLEMIRQGASLEECLAQYPAYARELEPLLISATTAPAGQELPYTARSRMRTRVLAEWDRRHAPRRRRWSLPSFAPRWAMATAMVLGVMLLGGAGTAMAAQDSVPGAGLYSVKQLEEQTRLWFSRSPEVKVATYSELVRERAKEIRLLAEKGDASNTAVAVDRLEQHLSDASQLIEETSQQTPQARSDLAPRMLETIDQAVVEQGPTVAGVQNTLARAPDESYPCLRYSLKAIQTARQRVMDAAEKIGRDPGQSSIPQAVPVGSLCPE